MITRDSREAVEIINKARESAKKFVDKVESGRAKSVETYKDMKEILKLIEAYTNSGKED